MFRDHNEIKWRHWISLVHVENKLFEFTLKVNLNFIFYQCNIVTYYYIWKNTSLVHISQSPSTVTNASSDIFLQISKRSDCSPLSSLIHFAQYLLTPVFKAEDLAFFISSYIITPHSSKLVITVNVCSMVYVQISDVAEQSGAPALFVCPLTSSIRAHYSQGCWRRLFWDFPAPYFWARSPLWIPMSSFFGYWEILLLGNRLFWIFIPLSVINFIFLGCSI